MKDDTLVKRIEYYYSVIYSLIDDAMYLDEDNSTICISKFLEDIDSEDLKHLINYINIKQNNWMMFSSKPDEVEKKNRCLINIINRVIIEKSNEQVRK